MITPPGELSPLTAALQEAGRSPTDTAKASVYRQLVEAVLLAPLDPESTEQRAILLVERRPDGRHELPAFSCQRAFALWGGVPTHLALRAPDLFTAALMQGVDRVTLDPAGPVRVTLGSWEVRRIAAGSASTTGSRPPFPAARCSTTRGWRTASRSPASSTPAPSTARRRAGRRRAWRRPASPARPRR